MTSPWCSRSKPALLHQITAGDKIRIAADKSGGAYTVTKIEPAK